MSVKTSLKIVLFIFLSSCGIIAINENNFRSLKPAELVLLKPFDQKSAIQRANNIDSIYLFETNPGDIKQFASKNRYTWVHLWRPFCPNDYCENLGFFSELADRYKSADLGFMLVSESYDIGDIRKIVKNSSYSWPIFVLQDAYFGHKIQHNRLKLFDELNNNRLEKSRYGFDDFLFKDTLLIFTGNRITREILDSLIL